jgi:hypothetical protein
MGQEVARHQPRQDGVADRVGHQRHPAQDQEVAEQGAGAGDQDARQQDGRRRAHGCPRSGAAVWTAASGGARSRSCRRCRAQSQTRPRAGAKRSETTTIAVRLRTIIGPVGSDASVTLRTAPVTPGGRPEKGGEGDHPAEVVRPLAGGGGRADQHRRHQDDADGLQPDHHRDDGQRGQEHLQPVGVEAQAGGELGIEREELELLEEDGDQQQGEGTEGGDGNDVARDEGGGLAEEELVEPGLVGVVALRDEGEEGDSEAEEGAEDDAHRGVLAEAGVADDAEQDQGAQPTRHRGAGEEDEGLFGAGQEVGKADARQGGVRQGIAEQALSGGGSRSSRGPR